MTSARIFFFGGIASYRALFGWLSPWVFIPSLLVAPVFQILLFVYIGRSAQLESDVLRMPNPARAVRVRPARQPTSASTP